MKLVIKNILLCVGVIVTLLLYTELYFENSLFRWVFVLIVSSLVCYIVLFPIFRLLNENGGKSDELLDVDEIKNDEMNELDVNESDYTSTSNSVFRIYTKDSAVDGWLVSENDGIKKTVCQDMMGYIPLESKLAKPEYIPSELVIRIEFLFVREQPKYSQLKHVVLTECPSPTFDILRGLELKSKLSKESKIHTLIIAQSNRSCHFNPLNELVRHTARSFRQKNRVINFSSDYLVNAMTLCRRLNESSSDVIIMETFYYKVIGTKSLDIQIHQKQQDIAEYILDSKGDKALDISQDDESIEKHRAERNKERKILEDTVNVLKSLVKYSN